MISGDMEMVNVGMFVVNSLKILEREIDIFEGDFIFFVFEYF